MWPWTLPTPKMWRLRPSSACELWSWRQAVAPGFLGHVGDGVTALLNAKAYSVAARGQNPCTLLKRAPIRQLGEICVWWDPAGTYRACLPGTQPSQARFRNWDTSIPSYFWRAAPRLMSNLLLSKRVLNFICFNVGQKNFTFTEHQQRHSKLHKPPPVPERPHLRSCTACILEHSLTAPACHSLFFFFSLFFSSQCQI